MSENQTAGHGRSELASGATGTVAEPTTLSHPVTPAPPPSVWAQPSPYAPPPGYATSAPVPSADPYPTAAGPVVPGGPPGPGQRSGGGWRRGAVATVAAVAIALTAGGAGGFVGYALHDEAAPLQSTPAVNRNVNVVDRSSLADVAAKVQPTVVDIKTQSGEGSGVVISADGYIVTNNHVVATARGATVTVTFNSGRQLDARIVGTDAKTDIAVVKVDATGLTAAQWGDSDALEVGDTVLAIGSPLGLAGSVTEGIVSALHRTITVGGGQAPGGGGSAATTYADAIQTDAAINEGNSGGALVDLDGKLIGINSAIATSGSTGNIGVGFAISANRAKEVADALIRGQKVSHPYLGVSVGDAQGGGAQIQTVQDGSPADQAGLEVGDVVTKVNDKAISSSLDLVGAIQSATVGEKLTLTVQRGGSDRTITATIGETP